MSPRLFVVMGVSGTGKSSVGRALAEALAVEFIEGDDYHGEKNLGKMSQGIALDDDDRWPWLQRLNSLAREYLATGKSLVVSCSALKFSYRDVLLCELESQATLLVLEAPPQVILQRMAARQHFFNGEDLLQSQLAIYQPPTGESAFFVDVSQSLDEVVAECVTAARRKPRLL